MIKKRFTINGKEIIQNKQVWCMANSEHCADVIATAMNELHEENYKIKSLLLKKVEELNDAYNKSAKTGMPTGGIIGELDSFEEICRIMEWIE